MGMIIITLDDYESGAQARRALREFLGAEEIRVKPAEPVVLDELDGWDPEIAKPSPRSEMEAAKEEVKAASAPPPPPKEEPGEDAPPPPANDDDGPVKLDSDGLPWDHRIHASSKKTLKSGQWRKKRGIKDDLVAEVEAELRAAIAAPTPPPPADEPTAPDAPAPPPPPAADEQTVAAPPPPPAADEVPHTLADLMKRVTAADMNLSDIQPILQEMGVPSLPALNSRPDLVPVVYKKLFAEAT